MAETVKKVKRRSRAELLEETKKRLAELEELVRAESISEEEKKALKGPKQGIINAANRIKTLEEADQWIKALEGIANIRIKPAEVKDK